MFIPNDSLIEIAMQDIVNANSARAIQTFLDISFDLKSIANFYLIGSSSLLACYNFEKYKNSNIKDDIS